MRFVAYLKAVFESLGKRARAEQELDEELRQHIRTRAEQLQSSGMSAAEARRQARIEFGNTEKFKEECREERGSFWLETLWSDVRFGLRLLRKSPGFTFVAVLTLALGIGANTAIFTSMNALMFRTLPIQDPGQFVELLHQYPGEPAYNGFSWNAYQAMRRDDHVFSDLFIGSTMNFGTVRGDNLQPQTLFVGSVGGNFFQALGVRAAAGRLIGPEDVHMGDHAPVAVVSWSFWKSRFNLDPGIIGKTLVINDDPPLTIIGVTQRGFYGLNEQEKQDIWWPRSLGPSQGWGIPLLARLKRGVSIEQAQAEMGSLFQTVVNAPDVDPWDRRMKLRIEPAGNGVTTPLSQMLSTPLTVLMATVGLLLLLTCANLAGLLLARGASRQHEMAVRACLGAARTRLLRQTLTESLLLSLAGCAVGIFFAYFAAHALVRVFASGRFIMDAPMHFEALTTPDAHVVLFTGAIVLLTGLLCGAVPAMRASNMAPASALQPGSRVGETKRQRLFGRGLVALQVALSLVLVSSAALFVEYLSNLRNLDLGFTRNNLLLVTLDFAHSGYDAAQFSRLSQELVMRLDAIPGVSSATFSTMSPMEGPGASSFVFAKDHPEKRTQTSINYVASDYFQTYGTPFLAGRDFSARDQASSRVAIINEAVARDCFGNENPIGRHITLSHITLTKGEKTYEVVGVVGNAKYNDLQQPGPPTIYAYSLQEGFIGSQLAVRTRIDPAGVASAVRQAEADVLKTVPIARIMTMNEQIDSSIVPERLIAMLSTGFGALGALLAAIGLYGLLAYTVARRTHEIGVRIAMGATRSDVIRMTLHEALWMVCAGLALGAPLAFWGKRVAASLIPGLPVANSLPIVVAAAIMIVVGLIAAYLPARRAMRVDPMVALRYE
ncbi:MAG TPA: ABC transporter permease [Candidatus Saccharimonadales bacterium]|nr:ABC transporter permease [Candidatus Saccharimonadales bacterium]